MLLQEGSWILRVSQEGAFQGTQGEKRQECCDLALRAIASLQLQPRFKIGPTREWEERGTGSWVGAPLEKRKISKYPQHHIVFFTNTISSPNALRGKYKHP